MFVGNESRQIKAAIDGLSGLKNEVIKRTQTLRGKMFNLLKIITPEQFTKMMLWSDRRVSLTASSVPRMLCLKPEEEGAKDKEIKGTNASDVFKGGNFENSNSLDGFIQRRSTNEHDKNSK